MADIIKATGLPVIMVSQPGLGAVNHACLSFGALKERNIKIAGFVFNYAFAGGKAGLIEKDNAKVIEQFSGVKYLGSLPFLKVVNKKTLLDAFDRMPGVKTLIDGV